MNDLKDWRKKPIEVGCVIVYPTTASSNIYMNEAVVAEVYYEQDTRYQFSTDPATGQRTRTPYTIDIPRLRVRKTIEHGYSTSDSNQGKLTKIGRVDRVTVVQKKDSKNCNEFGCQFVANHANFTPGDVEYHPLHSWEA